MTTPSNEQSLEGLVEREELERLQKLAGIPNLPTQETYWYRRAVAGDGPYAADWIDKPHRLIYDLCRIIEANQVPDGWKLVPVEPDRAMKEAAFGPIIEGGRGGPIKPDFIRQEIGISTYRRMVAAAPALKDASE